MVQRVLPCLCVLSFGAALAQPFLYVDAYPINGDAADDWLGYSVTGVGDINNDGYDDFAIVLPRSDFGGFQHGLARVYSGRDGSVIYTYNSGGNVGFAQSISGAGDVNNDGRPDLIIGSSYSYIPIGPGYARIYSGVNGSLIRTLTGDFFGDGFGSAVSGAGDVNNDGFDDVIVGAFDGDGAEPGSGFARVYSGANGALLWSFQGLRQNDDFGWSVAGAGDVNNDGFDDVIVGARYAATPNAGFGGSATVYSGMTGMKLYEFFGNQNDLGTSVSGAGDVNNDGFDDVIVGAPGFGAGDGFARVFSGADGSILHTFAGVPGLGYSVDSMGDIDGDGFDDVMAAGRNNRVRVYSGATGAILADIVKPQPGSDDYGYSAACIGDINNDDIPDLIVGAPLDDNAGMDSGSAFIYRSVVLPTPCPGDANGDGLVNFADLNITVSNFNTTCPTP